MMRLRIWIITILLTVGLAACTSEVLPTPQPTPETELADLVTVTVEHVSPSITVKSIPTNLPITISTSIPVPPTETPVPELTSTPLPLTSEPTPLPLKLQQNIEVVLTVDNVEELFWSPTNHEFVWYSCPRGESTTVQMLNVVDMRPQDITPIQLQCFYLSILWHPSGEYFFVSGEPLSQDGYDGGGIYGWKLFRDNSPSVDLGNSSSYWGWMNENIRVSQQRVGTGMYSIGLSNIETEERISGTGFDGLVKDVSENFVVLNEESPVSFNTSVAVLAQEQISPEHDEHLRIGQYVKFPGKKMTRTDWDILFYSRFADVRSQTDQVLIVTWEDRLSIDGDYEELLFGRVSANLQLWDAQTDKVAMVLPDGIYGRFSPDGSIVAAMTADKTYPNLQLFSYPEGENFLLLPAYAEANRYSAEVFAFTTFSPNGRYFTFFTPETDLVVYDLHMGEMMPPITAVPAEPLWSPDNTRFVYTDPMQGLSIYDIRTRTTYPLAETGSERLSNPQWSFDGTYLSVAYRTDHHTWETAVISLP